MDCLTYTVGLTDNTCECWQGDAPQGYNTSDTGYYLTDEVDGFPLLEAVFESLDCGGGATIFSVLESARESAIRELVTDVGARIIALRDGLAKREMFIGRNVQKNGIRPRYGEAGIRILPATGLRDAVLQISQVRLGTVTAGDVDVTLKKDGEAVGTVTISTQAGKWNPVNVDWSLPFYNADSSEAPVYTITYPTAGVTCIGNNFFCCGYKPEWKRKQYFLAEGQDGEVNNPSAAFGLSLSAAMSCDMTNWLCRAEASLVRVAAKAIQFKGAEHLARYVLDSSSINRYTMLDAAKIERKIAHYSAEYVNRIEYLAQNAPETACAGCKKPKVAMTTATL